MPVPEEARCARVFYESPGAEHVSVSREREPPVILMSAAPEQAAIQVTLTGNGAIRCLAKPFDVDELVAAVREAAACCVRSAPTRSA